jgi:acetolactate synthase-1/3 small subunit
MRQTLIATVENKPGVLNRVASLFRRRNFNIDSLNVGRTEDPNLSRMTIVVDSRDVPARQVEANLYKLVNVVDVQDVTSQGAILSELALIKIDCLPERRAEVIGLASVFNAAVLDVSKHTMVIQIAAESEKVDSLLNILRPFGIRESVRTGHVAMTRGASAGIRHTPGAHGVAGSYSNGSASVSAD